MFWNQKVSSRKWGSRDMQLVEQWVGDSGGDSTQVKLGLRATANQPGLCDF